MVLSCAGNGKPNDPNSGGNARPYRCRAQMRWGISTLVRWSRRFQVVRGSAREQGSEHEVLSCMKPVMVGRDVGFGCIVKVIVFREYGLRNARRMIPSISTMHMKSSRKHGLQNPRIEIVNCTLEVDGEE
jgi:hypothetical protein